MPTLLEEHLCQQIERLDLQLKAMGEELTSLAPTPQIEHLLKHNVALRQTVLQLEAEVQRLSRSLEGRAA